ncbi:MAG: hypothetical protein O7D91_07400 [Planctomycetota bacterium]|nr:hypothetical protein [Planctomycetota bacterium]
MLATFISDINDLSQKEDVSTTIEFSISDDVVSAATLTVSGTSSEISVVPNANIVFGGKGSDRTVTITPAENQFGTTTVTITVENNMDGMASDSFQLTIEARNDAPVNSVPGPQTIEANTSLQFSTAAGNPISVSDIDAGDSNIRVMLRVENGTLMLPTTDGVSVNGNGTAGPDVNGTIPAINTAFDGLTSGFTDPPVKILHRQPRCRRLRCNPLFVVF